MAPDAVWETAETSEMRDVIELYGKTYHMWQVDRGDKVPLGPPQLMMSFTHGSQLNFDDIVGERDQRYGVDSKHKAKLREDIPDPRTHEDADSLWSGNATDSKGSERAGADSSSAQILKGTSQSSDDL
ncbi:MAG: Cytoplasmic glyoxalase II [Chaenotheca gracillima]|nr:MAG: Cytoplasmic glyoxalase II [Chaenotheca gracillima]